MGESNKGALALFIAYLWWGAMPVYWKAISHVASTEILAQRVIWSMVYTLAVILIYRDWRSVADFVRSSRAGFLCLIGGGFLITANWGLYIWAVNHGRILESSLGYFINPLVSMFLGLVFFREKLRGLQWAALVCAAVGVCVELAVTGSIPLVSLGLAFTFGLYGALKKAVRIQPAAGLFIETAVAAPFALIYLFTLQKSGVSSYPYDMTTNLLLAGTGVMTSIPLILFAFGAKRVRLTTIGFIQYISPTLTFIIGTLVYDEPLHLSRIVTFAFIWCALAVYSVDAIEHGFTQKNR